MKDVRTDGWAKAVKVRGVAPPPTSCAPYAKAAPKPGSGTVAAALAERDPVKRDAMLAAVQPSPDLAPTLRAIRANLAPTECADAITDPALSAPTLSGMAGQMTLGLSLASKLSRTASQAPSLKDASDKEKVKRFIQGPLREWMVQQASAIDALSAPAGELAGLPRGVVAIEAGMADLRLVDRIRSAPTPSNWDKELKAVYEAALDEALEPRKVRGRDAALVGLAEFAAAGVVEDDRVERARALLSKLYGGRRIDALDALLLSSKDLDVGAIPQTVLLLAPDDDRRAKLSLPAPSNVKSARTRFEMGRKYWRRVDFVEAAYGASKDVTPEARLVLALSLTLAKGPRQAREMMETPASALRLGSTDALDALAAGTSPVAGFAAFDAAHLRSLSPPEGAAAGPFFGDVAARFRKASALLEDPAQKKRAEERAAEAESLAKSIAP
jgi:hypothetical protein